MATAASTTHGGTATATLSPPSGAVGIPTRSTRTTGSGSTSTSQLAPKPAGPGRAPRRRLATATRGTVVEPGWLTAWRSFSPTGTCRRAGTTSATTSTRTVAVGSLTPTARAATQRMSSTGRAPTMPSGARRHAASARTVTSTRRVRIAVPNASDMPWTAHSPSSGSYVPSSAQVADSSRPRRASTGIRGLRAATTRAKGIGSAGSATWVSTRTVHRNGVPARPLRHALMVILGLRAATTSLVRGLASATSASASTNGGAGLAPRSVDHPALEGGRHG